MAINTSEKIQSLNIVWHLGFFEESQPHLYWRSLGILPSHLAESASAVILEHSLKCGSHRSGVVDFKIHLSPCPVGGVNFVQSSPEEDLRPKIL